ncbi:hypothetical protein ACGFZR_14940 [Streptomyces sp. NPDC048241]|uniref:hypothetical protein n=1 Tax=Streptomyces sp. NPDC048241 TaxID=3365521 RepID=UPI003718FA19
MTTMEDPIPVLPRTQDAPADIATLVRLGEEEPPPIPEPATDPFLEPDYPGMPTGWTPDDAA